MSFSAKYVYMLSYRLTVVYTVVPENGFMKTEVVSFWCHFQRLFSSMWWLYTKYDRWQVIPWRIWRLLLHKTELIFWVRQFYCFSDMGVLIAPIPVCWGFLFTEKSWSRKIMKCLTYTVCSDYIQWSLVNIFVCKTNACVLLWKYYLFVWNRVGWRQLSGQTFFKFWSCCQASLPSSSKELFWWEDPPRCLILQTMAHA